MARRGFSHFATTVVFALLAPGAAVPAAAQPVAVTSGYLDMQGASGALLLGGERGFTFDGPVTAADGVFGPGACNSAPNACVSGATVDLTALWTGTDLPGTATLNGEVYRGLGSLQGSTHAAVQFAGAATLPLADGLPRDLAARFTFSGTLDYVDGSGVPTRALLSGAGTAVVSLTPNALSAGGWRIARVFYAFDSALPAGWVAADVGSVGTDGHAGGSSSRMIVSGAGADVWGTADGLAFVFQPVGTDSTVVTRVDGMTASHPFAKAGVMLRTGTGASAGHAILDVKPDGEVEFMTRSADGLSTSYVNGGLFGFPAWLKLQRQNDLVVASASSNGSQWVQLGTAVVQRLRFAGLAVTSHDPDVLNDATFGGTAISQNTVTAAVSSWQHGDVGSVGIAGTATGQADAFTVRAAGADIWGAADSFHFVYQPLHGSGVVGRFISLQNAHPFAKAGVMIRNSPEADAAHVVLDVKPSGEIEFMSRTADGGGTSYLTGSWMAFPGWLELRREGNTFTGYRSTDGVTWNVVGAVTVPLSADTVGGVAVTSHDTTVVTEATVDRLTVLP